MEAGSSLGAHNHGRSRPPLIITIVVAWCVLIGNNPIRAEEKVVIGATARVEVIETGIGFNARVNTAGALSSIHATDLEIEDAAEEMLENVGKKLMFTTTNEKGESARVAAEIADVVVIKASMGAEYRYIVWLTVVRGDKRKRIGVTPTDRGKMNYKFLLGRNWLSGDYLVDVDR